MAGFHFDLVSPEKLIFSGEVEAVVLPGTEGEFTVLKDHAPLMSTLRRGILAIVSGTNATAKYYVKGGFADVSSLGLTVLADYADPLEDFDFVKLDHDIAEADVEFAAVDVNDDDLRRHASEKRDQLIELKKILGR